MYIPRIGTIPLGGTPVDKKPRTPADKELEKAYIEIATEAAKKTSDKVSDALDKYGKVTTTIDLTKKLIAATEARDKLDSAKKIGQKDSIDIRKNEYDKALGDLRQSEIEKIVDILFGETITPIKMLLAADEILENDPAYLDQKIQNEREAYQKARDARVAEAHYRELGRLIRKRIELKNENK